MYLHFSYFSVQSTEKYEKCKYILSEEGHAEGVHMDQEEKKAKVVGVQHALSTKRQET